MTAGCLVLDCSDRNEHRGEGEKVDNRVEFARWIISLSVGANYIRAVLK